MKKSKRKLALSMLAEILLILLFVVAIVIYYNNVIKKDISDLHYKIATGEEQEIIENLEVIKEKGKEPIYRFDILGKQIEVQEAVYEEYIGDGNNAISIQTSEMKVYTRQVFFAPSFSYYISESRIAYPWQDDIKPYTKKDAEVLANKFLNKEISATQICRVPKDYLKF